MIDQRMTIIPTLKLFSHDDAIAKIRRLDYRYRELAAGLSTGPIQDFLLIMIRARNSDS